MTKTRLTNQMRQRTCKHLIESTFRERELRMEQREKALALRILRRELGEDALIRISSLPPGWLPLVQRLRFANYEIHRANYQTRERGYRSGSELYLPEAMTVPSFVSCNQLEVSAQSIAEIDAFVADWKLLQIEREKLTEQVLGTLGGFYTVKAFAEEWPEGYTHFPHPELAPTTLPAVRINDLNARIEAAKAA